MERPQVNIRLEKDLLDEIDALASAERVDRSEMTRRLLSSAMSIYRMERALGEYRRGNVSAWKAASLAGVSLYEMLDHIQEAGIPHEMDPEVLQRLDSRAGPRVVIREGRAPYATTSPDAASGIAELRQQFKPERVKTLFVGESSPASGTHFYRANSNLFRATQAAFSVALGERVPQGPRFLHWFRDQGCWLVDLADRPVNRLGAAERTAAVLGGVDGLTVLIREEHPETLVAVKASIAAAVRQAASQAGFAGALVELPFPVRQWRDVYIRELSRALDVGAGPGGPSPSDDSGPDRERVGQRPTMTLDEAIEEALQDHGNRPMTTREISEEIRRRGTYCRPSDGMPPPPSQISARVSNKSYRDRFERTPKGIRLRR